MKYFSLGSIVFVSFIIATVTAHASPNPELDSRPISYFHPAQTVMSPSHHQTLLPMSHHQSSAEIYNLSSERRVFTSPSRVISTQTWQSRPDALFIPTQLQFVYVPELGYYAAAQGQDLFYDNNFYYRYLNERWFRSAVYNGQWTMLENNLVPRMFYQHRSSDRQRFVDHEFRRYRTEGSRYTGRIHNSDAHRTHY